MTDPGAAAVWTLLVGVIVTIVGAAATLVINRRNDRLKARLEFVNMQLRYFYGPLLANFEASQRAYAAFRRKYNAAASVFWDPTHRPSEDDLAAWHHWMTTVFMPIHARSMKIINKRTDLLVGSGMPQCLADLCAHVLALRAVLAQWNEDPNYVPQIPAYPSHELGHYLSCRGSWQPVSGQGSLPGIAIRGRATVRFCRRWCTRSRRATAGDPCGGASAQARCGRRAS